MLCDLNTKAFNDLANTSVSVSVSVSGVMLSAMIVSTIPTIQEFQQYASEWELRTQDHVKSSNTPTVTAVDN